MRLLLSMLSWSVSPRCLPLSHVVDENQASWCALRSPIIRWSPSVWFMMFSTVVVDRTWSEAQQLAGGR